MISYELRMHAMGATVALSIGGFFIALRVGWLQRGYRALRPRDGLADASAQGRVLRGVDRDLLMGKSVRLRFSICRPVVRAPVLTCVDRFSRHSGSFHAREALRLFRE